MAALLVALGPVDGARAAATGLAPASAPASALASAAHRVAPVAAHPALVPTAVVVSPDPAHDLYIGSGGLVIPAGSWSGSDAERAAAAGCGDCRWRVSVLCTKSELAAGRCLTLRLGCPTGTVPVRIWLLPAAGCLGGRRRDLPGRRGTAHPGRRRRRVHDHAAAALPPLRAAVQPADGALVGLPAVFRTGQPAAGHAGADLSVLGLDVRLDARVRWLWTYGDGTSDGPPGRAGRGPTRRSATPTARRDGDGDVRAVWRGEYTVEGLGPYAVPGAALVQTQR